jgi:hypothetical protein
MPADRIAARDSPERHRTAADNSILCDRIARIYRATRLEATSRPIHRMDKRRDRATINRKNPNSDRSRSTPNRYAQARTRRGVSCLTIHSSNRRVAPHLHLGLFLLDGKPETCVRFQIRIRIFSSLYVQPASCAFGADARAQIARACDQFVGYRGRREAARAGSCDHDYRGPLGERVADSAAENFADPALHAISDNSIADSARDGDAQARALRLGFEDTCVEHEVWALEPQAIALEADELTASMQPVDC